MALGERNILEYSSKNIECRMLARTNEANRERYINLAFSSTSPFFTMSIEKCDLKAVWNKICLRDLHITSAKYKITHK